VGAPTAACDPRRDTWGVGTISIPPQLADALTDDDDPARVKWLEALPKAVAQIASDWELELGEPFLPGGVCAWVARARNAAGDELVLKVGWRHHEAEHEADGLRHWDGDGAVRCFAARSHGDTSALLLERCTPGGQLGHVAPEHRQDEIIAGLLRRLWMRVPGNGHPFRPLSEMCDQWADGLGTGSRPTDAASIPVLRATASSCYETSPAPPAERRCCVPICTPATCSPPNASRGW
jgi:hypothetical protein